MVKTAPASSLIVAQSQFLLQFVVAALDDPALLSQAMRTRWERFVEAGKVDNQFLVGSASCFGHSINSHCSGGAAR